MRDDTTALLYNASDPIDQLWTHINDYSTMANAAKSPATSQQLIDIGKIILQRAGCFTHDLRLWNARPIDEQTWLNFLPWGCSWCFWPFSTNDVATGQLFLDLFFSKKFAHRLQSKI